MQADSSALKKCSENEAFSIKFRPSPNFKHMKKYLKSKFEEDMNSSTSLSTEEEQRAEQKGAVQPPLPPNPPPPFSPPRVKVKQEVVDHEYEKSERAEEPPPPEPATNGSDRPVMCKDFVRGTCTRGSFCIYAHKLDLTQLDGVYRFCRDFENKRCIRPVCYFVHATTFEKEHFMRTGTLPPHATAHLRASAAAPPLPLPPPTHHRPDVPGDHTTGFANMPAPALASGAEGACAGAGALPARAGVEPLGTLPPLGALPARAGVEPLSTLPPLGALPDAAAPARKRDWRDTAAFTGSQRDLDLAEQPPKKCKHCDYNELRLQHSKAQVASVRLAAQELDDQLEKLMKSNGRLNSMLKMLLKPRRPLENVTLGSNFLGAGRLAADDASNDILRSEMKVLLAKILLGSDVLPSENGRDLSA